MALPWEWVDPKNQCIHFGDTKSGAQIRPIGVVAMQILRAERERILAHKKNAKWVFPGGRGTSHFIGLPKVMERICVRAGLVDVTIHTLRHTFAAVAAELGFSELTIAGMLGHKVSGITARYAHVPDKALIAAATQVSDHIALLLNGSKHGK